MAIHVFAGPTLGHSEVCRRLPEALLHGPVRHGDLLRPDVAAEDVVLIVDGLFHQEPPVRHKEILHVMDKGVTVIGASSMGALRAAELYQYGMIGIGSVFEMYRDGVIEADDEVAVTHGPLPDWRVFSEALVNVRHSAALCAAASVISAECAEDIVDLARQLPYASRSWPAIEADAARRRNARLQQGVNAVRQFLASRPGVGNLKRQDALRAIDAIAESAFAPAPEADQGWRGSDEWRTTHLARWAAQFHHVQPSLPPGSGLALFNYERIYDTEYPRRWERHVLRGILQSAGLDDSGPTESLREQAVSSAARAELGLELLTAEIRAEWLIPEDLMRCDERGLMIHVLVRSSCKSDLARTPWEDGLVVDIGGAERAVREALSINRQVAQADFSRNISNLRVDRLKAHLGTVWSLGPDVRPDRLTAESRDRGFASADDAAEAARLFFLRNSEHTSQLADRMLAREREGSVNA
jgi:hypothetical protein